MRKFYVSLLALALMVVGTATVKAQNPKLSELEVVNANNPYVLTLNFKEGNAYEGLAFSANLEGIYDALGTTAEEFDATAAQNVWTPVAGENGALADELQLPENASGGAWYGRYSDAAPFLSVPMTWGSKTTVGEGEEATDVYLNTFYLQDISLAEGVFTVGSTGQYERPVMHAGEGDYTNLYIVNGTKAVQVKVEAVLKAPMEVPFTSDLSQLNIISEIESNVEVTVGKTAEAQVDVTDLVNRLMALAPGITAEDINDVVGKMTAAEKVGEEDGYPSGELQQLSEHNWLAFDYDAVKKLCYVTDMSGDVVYNAFEVWEPALTEEETDAAIQYIYSITVDLGAKKMEAGDTKSTDLYLVYSNYAIKVRLNVTALEPEKVELTKAGETTVQISAEIDDSYTTKPFTVDMEAVTAALGCEASQLEDIYAWAEEGVLYDGAHTEGSGGWYLNEEGFVASWGSSSAFFVALNGSDAVQNGTYTIGQMSGHFTNIEEDTTVKAQLLYIYDDKYYAVNIEYTVTLPQAPPEEYSVDDEFGEIVAVIPVTMQLKPSSNYYAQEDEETQKMMQKDFDLESVKALLGEGTYTFYGLTAPKVAGGSPSLQTSVGYGTNAGFNGGFWMNKPKEDADEEYVNTAFVGSWGDNAYGIEWNLETGIFGFDQFPDANTIGTSYESTFYWALSDNSKAIKYLLTVEYVENPQNIGTATIIDTHEEEWSIELDEDLYYTKAIDKAYLMETFGISEEELETLEVNIAASPGYYVQTDAGLVDTDGFLTDEPTEGEPLPFGTAYLSVDLFDLGEVTYEPSPDPEAEREFTEGWVRIAFDYTADDGIKRILYTIHVATGAYIATSINGINSKANNAGRYNLAGQKVNAAYKGIVIEGGKKILVK